MTRARHASRYFASGPVWATLAALLALCCKQPIATANPSSADAPLPTAASSAAALPSSPLVHAAGETFVLHLWSFETASTSFTIDDLAMQAPLAQALRGAGRLAINGGFFGTDGRPIGLAVSDGKTLSQYSEKLSGGVFFVADGVARIEATEGFDAAQPIVFAVQCRPRLVVHGQANVKRDDGQRAERTALCTRGAGRTVDVMIAEPAQGTLGPSLYALGQYLASERHCDDALNLDGGPSTGAEYRGDGQGHESLLLPPRGPLRHAIVLGDRGHGGR